MNLILWFLAVATILVFWKFYFYPYIHDKYTFWKLSRHLRKMANKYSGETKEKLIEISKMLNEISKATKLGDNDGIDYFNDND